LTSANWHRAADILGELRQRATSDSLHNSVRLFYDWCILLLENEEVQATSALQEAIQLILENKA
jgi:DNA polymerase III delta subunit